MQHDRPPNEPFLARTVVIIPALNEAPCVASTVAYWRARGAALVRVVDNGSTDDTADRARAVGAGVVREPQRGYGAAAWTGTRALPAGIEWILFSSADGSDRLDDAERAAFQHAIDGGADLVLGERVSLATSRGWLTPTQRFGNAFACWLTNSASQSESSYLTQRFGNAFACWLLALGWGRRFRDMASLRAIRRDRFEALRLTDRAFGWNVEMQVRAVELGLRIAEVPVRFFPRVAGESKISGNLPGIVRAGWGILAMVAKLHAGRAERARQLRRRATA